MVGRVGWAGGASEMWPAFLFQKKKILEPARFNVYVHVSRVGENETIQMSPDIAEVKR